MSRNPRNHRHDALVDEFARYAVALGLGAEADVTIEGGRSVDLIIGHIGAPRLAVEVKTRINGAQQIEGAYVQARRYAAGLDCDFLVVVEDLARVSSPLFRWMWDTQRIVTAADLRADPVQWLGRERCSAGLAPAFRVSGLGDRFLCAEAALRLNGWAPWEISAVLAPNHEKHLELAREARRPNVRKRSQVAA
jgi:hypothetical protein